MGSLPKLTGKGVGYESAREERIQNAIDGMVEEPVADRCFANTPGLGVGNVEGVVWTVMVCFGCEIGMERQDIIHETQIEFLHINFIPFAWNELLPCGKQVL